MSIQGNIDSLESKKIDSENKVVQLEKKIAEQKATMPSIERKIIDKLENAVELSDKIPAVLTEICDELEVRLADYKRQITSNSANLLLPVVHSVDLNSVDWSSYSFKNEILAESIVVGREHSYLASQTGLGRNIEIPKMQSFFNSEKCYAVFDDEYQIDTQQGLDCLHERVFRLVSMMPHSSKFTLFDLDGLGRNFIYQNDLPKTRKVEDVHKTLNDISSDIQRIYSLFSIKIRSLIDFDDASRGNEDFEFIMVANFPRHFDAASIKQLARIAENGPKCGKYVFLHIDEDAEFPSGTSLSMFKNLEYLPWRILNEHEVGKGFSPVRQETMQAILDGIQKAEKQGTELSFDEGTPFSANSDLWWKEDPTSLISTPIGGSGGKKNDLKIWFGEGKESVCAHGMLGATTGAGKSNLYHTFIMGLACRYSPDDLELYLVDGKQGVEFSDYRYLPHCRVVSLYTSPHLARSVLEELVNTMERRNELLTKYGVSSFSEYRKAGQPGGNMARIVIVVDEYQTFFEDDREGNGSNLMLKLVSQSRSAGIHLFVGSQRFNVSGMQKQQSIFGNMHLRIGMKMTASDITALNEFQNGGKLLLRSCQEVGQAVINDALGDDSSNIQGRIFRMKDEMRKNLIERFRVKWQTTYPDRELESPVILNGTEQPKLSENPQMLHLLNHYRNRPSSEQWKEFAEIPQHAAGLGVDDWYPVENPRVFWLGQQQNIHGQSSLILRCRQSENLMIVGGKPESRLALMSMIAAQIPINHSSKEAYAYIYDCAIEGSPWHGVLEQVAHSIPHEIKIAYKQDEFSCYLDELLNELQTREALAAGARKDLPEVYLFINEAQRAEILHMSEGRFGTAAPSEQGQRLDQVISRGPELGIHVIMSVDSYRGVMMLMERGSVSKFRHRVALQMNDEDSFKFVNGRQASRLQAHGDKPLYGLYIEEMQNRLQQFKPYEYKCKDSLAAELKRLQEKYQRWEQA